MTKLTLEFYKSNARKAVLKRKDNRLKRIHHKTKGKLIRLLNDYRAAKQSLNDYDRETILCQEIMVTTTDSFVRHGDKNCLTPSITRYYISKHGAPLDVQAMDLTEQYGIEFTEEDFFQFMISYPGGRKSHPKYQELETVKDCIKQITKFNATPDFIKYLKNKLEPKSVSSAPF